VRLEGLGQFKKSSELIGNRTRDLPTCSIVPQPTALPEYLSGGPSCAVARYVTGRTASVSLAVLITG
jgi:hypothetical protein